MESAETLDKFTDLFQGNDEYYGTDEGGCVEAKHDWDEIAEWHLTGRIKPVGVYPIYAPRMAHIYKPDFPVSWGCVDFDEGYDQSLVHAKNLRAVLAEFSVTGWIERSRSKGYHVWVFCGDVAAASLVRRALLGACQVVEAPTKEVNPKQDTLGAGQVGNYVRLPYPGALNAASGGYASVYKSHRQIVLDGSDNITPIDWFCEGASEAKVSDVQLSHLADLWSPPKNHLLVPTRDFSNVEGDLWTRITGLARRIWEEGPRDDVPVTDKGYNNGRSSRLWKLACLLRDNARHSVDEVVTILQEADKRWGKFHMRVNGDDEIVRLVYKVYGMGDRD